MFIYFDGAEIKDTTTTTNSSATSLLGRFLVTEVTIFLLAPIKIKSVKTKFHRSGVSILKVIRLLEVAFPVFWVQVLFIFLITEFLYGV